MWLSRTVILGLLVTLMSLGCDDNGVDGDGDGDGDGDIDADSDGDGDGDGDGDSDSDGDGDGDTDTDADGDFDRFDADLEAGCDTAPGGVAVSDTATAMHQRVAWTGTHGGVIWATQGTSFGESEVYFSLLDADLNTLVDDTLVSGTGIMDDTPTIGLAWHSDSFHVVWREEPEGSDDQPVRYQRLGEDGTPIGEPQRLDTGTGATAWPVIVAGTDDLFVVWSDQRTGSYDIYGRSLTPDGTLGAEIPLAEGNLNQQMATVAFTGDDYLVVYMSEEAPEGLYAIKTTATEATAPVDIINEIEIIEPPNLELAGEGFSLLYRTLRGIDTRIFHAVLGLDGVLVTDPVLVIDNGRVYDSTHDGSNTIVAVSLTDFSRSQLIFMRLNADGTQLGDHMVVACAENISGPSISWTGEDFLVVWSESLDDIFMPSRLFAQRVLF